MNQAYSETDRHNICLKCWAYIEKNMGIEDCPVYAILEVNCAIHEDDY